MILINNTFSISRDSRNWILTQTTTSPAKSGKNKGKIITRSEEHYFSNLMALCARVIDLSLDPTHGMEKMLASLHETHRELESAIAQIGEAANAQRGAIH